MSKQDLPLVSLATTLGKVRYLLVVSYSPSSLLVLLL